MAVLWLINGGDPNHLRSSWDDPPRYQRMSREGFVIRSNGDWITSHCTRKTPLITPINGVITLLISGRGPPCSMYILYMYMFFYLLSSSAHLSMKCLPVAILHAFGGVRGGLELPNSPPILMRDDWNLHL